MLFADWVFAPGVLNAVTGSACSDDRADDFNGGDGQGNRHRRRTRKVQSRKRVAEDRLNIRARPAGDGKIIGVIPSNGDGIANFGCISGLTYQEWR
jgi:hypothetical protein